jgi:beta-phosphoglucomutase family hydrolase
MIEAVIFDLDGVIVESERAHIESEKQVMRKYGIEIGEDELHTFTGTTAKHMFTELKRKYRLDAPLERLLEEKDEILFRLLEEDSEPTKGVLEVIRKLRMLRVKLAIASSSRRKLLKFLVDKLGVEGFFDVIVSGDDIVFGKPDPEIFLKCAERLGVRVECCVVVEDAELGVLAAKRAGMKCVGYLNPESGKQDLSLADVVVDDFSNLDTESLLSL